MCSNITRSTREKGVTLRSIADQHQMSLETLKSWKGKGHKILHLASAGSSPYYSTLLSHPFFFAGTMYLLVILAGMGMFSQVVARTFLVEPLSRVATLLRCPQC